MPENGGAFLQTWKVWVIGICGDIDIEMKGMVKPDSMDESPQSIVSTANHSQSRLSGSVSGVRVTRVGQWGQELQGSVQVSGVS